MIYYLIIRKNFKQIELSNLFHVNCEGKDISFDWEIILICIFTVKITYCFTIIKLLCIEKNIDFYRMTIFDKKKNKKIFQIIRNRNVDQSIKITINNR